MSRFAQSGWKFYHWVHSSPVTADAVYFGAFYAEKIWRRLAYWNASRRPVAPKDLWERRYLVPSSSLTTGVTNICNAKCSFCAYPKVVTNKTLQTGIMPFDVFKTAVDEWSQAGGTKLDLTPVVGDPLIDPGLLEKVEYAVRQAKMTEVVLTTNAILFNRNKMYERLIDTGIHGICISTQGTSKEMYEKVYGVKHYDEVISGIHNLLEYNRGKGEPAWIVLRFRNAQKPSQIIRSKDFKERIKPYLSEQVRVNFTVDFDNWGGTIKAPDMQGTMRLRVLPPPLNIPCQRLFGFSVRHDGNVRLCGCRLTKSDLDDLVVGNIRQKSLKEISQSDAAWKIIEGFYSGNRPETCRECTFYTPINQQWLENRKVTAATPPSTPAPVTAWEKAPV
jgi:radical SAM protein with 4Fe4S-binding SPASM domain